MLWLLVKCIEAETERFRFLLYYDIFDLFSLCLFSWNIDSIM